MHPAGLILTLRGCEEIGFFHRLSGIASSGVRQIVSIWTGGRRQRIPRTSVGLTGANVVRGFCGFAGLGCMTRNSVGAGRVEHVWLTATDVATELRVGRDKVIGWIKRGELVAVDVAERLGGRPRYRVRRTDLDKFLATRTVVPPPKPTPRRRRVPDHIIEFY
jgi:excisionase family DNA binding protein